MITQSITSKIIYLFCQQEQVVDYMFWFASKSLPQNWVLKYQIDNTLNISKMVILHPIPGSFKLSNLNKMLMKSENKMVKYQAYLYCLNAMLYFY